MPSTPLETDYLVVGAGAMGLAFADTLFDETDARILLVDRHERPGGHWNHAYPFVRLHQPSAFYGVDSRPLGRGTKDTEGWNRGMYELPTGAEVLDYFDALVHERLLPSGRVQYLPRTDWLGRSADGTHRVTGLDDGRERRIVVRRKLVLATHTGTEVPATHPPSYAVQPGVALVPPNALGRVDTSPPRYTVVGGGKTGADTCVWLLQNGVAPDRLRWIVPNDAWWMDRANVQPGDENLGRFFGSLADQFECVAQAGSMPDLFDRLEACGQLLRLDPGVRPTKYRCATISREEMAMLRRVRDVVRLGRVQEIERSRVVLEQGTIDAADGEVFVDCSACAIPSRPGVPVFEGEDAIHLQLVRHCAPSFSGAMIAAIEARVADPAQRNALARPVPLPREDHHWLSMWAASIANRQRWSAHPPLMQWLERSRLDYGAGVRPRVPPAVMERYVRALKAAAPRVPSLLASLAGTAQPVPA